MDDILLGSHIGLKSPNYFIDTVKEALSYKENTFMFYTGAPQNTLRIPTDKLKINEGLEILKKNNIDINKVVVHAPYIINLANSLDESKFELAKNALKNELIRTNDFHVKLLILHPGSHVGAGEINGLNKVVQGLNEVLKDDKSDVIVCLETMAGKGSEVGKTFDEIAYIINHCEYKNRVGVTLDTCHIHDGGYDITDPDKILDEFDKIIGLKYLKVIHLNDSKNFIGSHKDRHENIGYGKIGFNTLYKWCHNERLKGIPIILETPYINDLAPYKDEIESLRSGIFNSKLKDIDSITLF